MAHYLIHSYDAPPIASKGLPAARRYAAIAPDAPFVAITGTNGKSTTTALIAHLLKADGRDVQLGGNIGTAICAALRERGVTVIASDVLTGGPVGTLQLGAACAISRPLSQL